MAEKVLLFSHNGFSDQNANGITMKNLLSAWSADEKAQFYCDVQPPDFSAACQHFRVTDVQLLKSFLGKKSRCVFTAEYDAASSESGAASALKKEKAPRAIPAWLKKQKYNFALKWTREYLRLIGPWGQKRFWKWLEEVDPDVIVYMVTESFFMDKLVLRVCEKTGKPLVLYNGEAYRIIDLKRRHGLERLYYRKVEGLYKRLHERASMVIFNSEMLKSAYEAMYGKPKRQMVAYNSAQMELAPYQPRENVTITYFGNLGVGRSQVLLEAADIIGRIEPSLKLQIYGTASEEFAQKFRNHKNIRYHGFIDAEQLGPVVEKSDILLHVESFDPEIVPKLRYAFSTKIAQCLCAGRCFVSYAPAETASSQYLASVEGAVLVSEERELERTLKSLICDGKLREEYARRASAAGLRNHHMPATAQMVREEIGVISHAN